ncbi:MAG TPA: hypothetical protein VGS79_14035 [Puia sp.]|nr:hypothetical protein [Puia sp.]
MNRKLLTALFTILGFTGYTQVKFDSGYFVTNDGRRNNCLIKNYDWHYNPTGFFYKQAENGIVEKASIDEVKEFGILNFSRYERFDLQVDTSAGEAGEMDDNSGPEYKRETVFLKVLVQGKATLYEYRKGNMTRYFFKTDSIGLSPLVHKTYMAAEDRGSVLENNLFRNQLISALRSPELNMDRFSRLSYTETSLISVFDAYNGSQHSNGEKIVLKHYKGQFNLNLRIGTDLSGLTVNQSYFQPSKTTYGNKISATAALETEFVLPYNRNKWAAVLQLGYHSYKADPGSSGSADYKYLELGVGAREYFFIGKHSRLFATVLGFIDEPIGSGAIFYGSDSLGTRLMYNVALNAGYKYKNKWSIELQYTLTRNILDSYIYFQGQLHTTSLIFAYTIL